MAGTWSQADAFGEQKGKREPPKAKQREGTSAESERTLHRKTLPIDGRLSEPILVWRDRRPPKEAGLFCSRKLDS